MTDVGDKSAKLFSVCESGDKCSLVKLIRSENVNPSAYDMVNGQGKTALHIACRHGHIDIVRMLVEVYGCSPKAVDNAGSTSFHDACYYDQVAIVDYFINTSLNPKEYFLNVDLNGNTPFHKANQSGSSHMVKYMLHIIFCGETPKKLSLDIHCQFSSHIAQQNSHYLLVRNKVGDTPIAVACRHGHLNIMKMYIRSCDQLQFSEEILENIPYLLNIASKCGQFEIAYFLQSKFGCISSEDVHVGCSHMRLGSKHYIKRDSYHSPCHSYPDSFFHEMMHEFQLTQHEKRWNCLAGSDESAVKPICTAVLHRDQKYVKKFLALQGESFCISDSVDYCHVACIADNVDILNHFVRKDMVLKFGNTLLHIACEWGSTNAVNYLIKSGKCDLNAINNHGETPLHIACRHGRKEIVELFCKSKEYGTIMVDKLSHSSESPLHLACLHTNPAMARLILDHGHLTNSDTPDKCGDTPLMNACHNTNAELIKLLVDKGCNPLYVNEHTKETPVHVACRMQKLDILQLLVNQFSGQINHRNNFGETPLCIALNYYCMDIVHFIVNKQLCDLSLSLCTVDAGPKDPESSSLHPIAVQMARKYHKLVSRRRGHNVFLSQPTGDTALHFACKQNDVELVQLLLKHCPVHIGNKFGDTPLHIAARNGNVLVVKCLTASYSKSIDSFLNKDGNSALHVACKAGSLKVVELLIDKCCVTLKNASGNSPIHIACYNKSAKLVTCLLEKCSGNFDCHRNNNNDTFLHVASKVGDIDTIKSLLDHCSTTCQNSNDDTPIHIACSANQQQVVECLLEKNSSSYPFVNKKGQTYLHAACNKLTQLDIVKMIFNKGYKTLGNHPDKNGDTPLHYACRFGRKEIVEYLMTSDCCDPYRFNSDGSSPLYCALQQLHFQLVQYVVMNKLCDLNKPLRRGSPLLHCLIELSSSEHQYYSRLLYERLQNHDEEELQYNLLRIKPDGRRLLPHLQRIIVDLLKLSKGDKTILDLNATDCHGNTVLHLACSLDLHGIVKMLLSTDAVLQSVSHRNHDNKSPIQLTRDYSTIRLLISYGANPEDVYDRFAPILSKSKQEQPLEPVVKVIVLGNSTAGKTTLVEVLKCNDKDVMHVKGSTAGIETSECHSNEFGRVTFHDFAGQPEFESSHSAFLESCSSSVQPPVFILVVDASQHQYIERRIHNWLSFIQNHCTYSTETPPHVIVVGSHLDKFEGPQFPHINGTFMKAIKRFESSEFECFKPVFLDCRKVGTKGMRKLLQRLNESCLSLKKYIELDCRCHILIASLAKWFPTESVVKVKDLQGRIRKHKSMKSQHPSRTYLRLRSIEYDLSEVLPISTDPLISLLKSLHNGGHILLLEGVEDSWIVMNQDALFKHVNGILFAPKEFEQHLELDHNTGVVPLSKLQNLFPSLDFNMVKQFLVHYEFCQHIDGETLQLIHGTTELQNDEHYYFFPGFVQSEKPAALWDTPKQSPYSYSCGWMLQCHSKQFLETRFLHILLLRLTFAFVAVTQSSTFKRKCDIWKNGIHWGTRNGVEVLVELIEDKTLVRVLVRCFEGQELEAIKLRTGVLKMIWEVKQKFCPRVTPDEYLIHPSNLADSDFIAGRISMNEIAQTILEGSLFVLGPTNKPLSLNTLLYFEPYGRMDV